MGFNSAIKELNGDIFLTHKYSSLPSLTQLLYVL